MLTEIEPKQNPKKLARLTENLWVFGVVVIVAAVMGHATIGYRYVQRISEGEVLAYETSEATRYLNKLDNAQRRQARTNESEIRLKELQAEFPAPTGFEQEGRRSQRSLSDTRGCYVIARR